MQAEAFASFFGQAENCGCNVTMGFDRESTAEIWAEAAVNAYAETCSSARPLPCMFCIRALVIHALHANCGQCTSRIFQGPAPQ